jgi:hypothetical protein
MARGEETEGREYIMTGGWRVDVRTGGEEGTIQELTSGGRRRGVEGGGLSDEDQLRADI